MLDEPLRRRLEALNRQPLPENVPLDGRHNAARPSGTLNRTRALRPTQNLLEIGEEVQTPAGNHLRIVQSVERIWKDGERLVSARHTLLKQEELPPETPSPPLPGKQLEGGSYQRELQALVDSFPNRVLFLDLETCGLAGAALFLVGLLRPIEGRLVVELLLARNYAEEKAVLISLWQRASMHDVLVTFNGKSFDWPMVHDRSTRHLLGQPVRPEVASNVRGNPLAEAPGSSVHSAAANSTAFPSAPVVPPMLSRRDPRPELIHVDMLHHARRRWRGRLPDCKLQTLERLICGRHRVDDIPGAQIPAAYQRFVETGQTREMESILFHNALDLVTLLDLSMRLAR